jgi:hypothetical protein
MAPCNALHVWEGGRREGNQCCYNSRNLLQLQSWGGGGPSMVVTIRKKMTENLEDSLQFFKNLRVKLSKKRDFPNLRDFAKNFALFYRKHFYQRC